MDHAAHCSSCKRLREKYYAESSRSGCVPFGVIAEEATSPLDFRHCSSGAFVVFVSGIGNSNFLCKRSQESMSNGLCTTCSNSSFMCLSSYF